MTPTEAQRIIDAASRLPAGSWEWWEGDGAALARACLGDVGRGEVCSVHPRGNQVRWLARNQGMNGFHKGFASSLADAIGYAERSLGLCWSKSEEAEEAEESTEPTRATRGADGQLLCPSCFADIDHYSCDAGGAHGVCESCGNATPVPASEEVDEEPEEAEELPRFWVGYDYIPGRPGTPREYCGELLRARTAAEAARAFTRTAEESEVEEAGVIAFAGKDEAAECLVEGESGTVRRFKVWREIGPLQAEEVE